MPCRVVPCCFVARRAVFLEYAVKLMGFQLFFIYFPVQKFAGILTAPCCSWLCRGAPCRAFRRCCKTNCFSIRAFAFAERRWDFQGLWATPNRANAHLKVTMGWLHCPFIFHRTPIFSSITPLITPSILGTRIFCLSTPLFDFGPK